MLPVTSALCCEHNSVSCRLHQEDGDARATSRPQDQTAYIMSLEQQNLHLKEANLNLQEVCFYLLRISPPMTPFIVWRMQFRRW